MGGAYIIAYGRTKEEAERLRDREVRVAREEWGLVDVRYVESKRIVVEPEDAQWALEGCGLRLQVGQQAWIAGAHVHS
jgi:hypothetical protein